MGCPLWNKERSKFDKHEEYLMGLLGLKKQTKPYNKYGTPFKGGFGSKGNWEKQYTSEQMKLWSDLLDDVKRFCDNRNSFPTRKGKEFSGVPIHFSTADKDQIR